MRRGGANNPTTHWRSNAGPRLRVLLTLLALCAAAGLAGVCWRYARVRDLERVTRSGLERVGNARGAWAARTALADWQRESAATLTARRDDWISYVVSHYSISAPAVRQLLGHVAGVDYGDRAADWERWNDGRRRTAKGGQPSTPARERVELAERWRAAIGLTSYFSTILPIDGRLFAGSLGASFDDASDAADGIVRIDGRTGDAQLIFEAPDKGPRDILGIAFARNSLVAACRNGFVYCTDLDGKLRWKAGAGAKLASIPLLFEAGRDGAINVAVVTATGRVAVFSMDAGRSLWTATIELAPRGFDVDAAAQSPEQAALRASLALGNWPGGGPTLFVATAGGNVYALAPGTGKIVWRQHIESGILAAPTFLPTTPQDQGGLVVGDANGRVWSMVPAAKSVETALLADLEHAVDVRVVATPRTIGGGDAASQVIACTAGDSVGLGGSIHRFSAGGPVWRFTPGGAIWATPAIADVNGDGQPEVIVASSNVTSDGDWWAWLSVVSSDGHLLRHVWLDAAVECAPVVSDVDGDGTLEILVADRSGLLHCIETRKAGPVEWGLSAGDPRNSGNAGDAYSFGQMPVGRQLNWKPR